MRQVLLYTDEEGNWISEIPSLPGCNSNGATRDEALLRVKEAMELWIEDAIEHDEEIPPVFNNPEIVAIEQPIASHE
jgi:predicted RNase H-like HicB family nuclease